jgi:hypothetical protein
MAATNTPEQNSITTRDTLISTISTRAVLLGAYTAKVRCRPLDRFSKVFS